MTTLYQNFLSGSIMDDPLSNNATAINSMGFTSMPVITSPDIMWLILDPNGTAGAPEVVQITNHLSLSTKITCVRAQQSTFARTHIIGTNWVVSITKVDLDAAYNGVNSLNAHIAAPDPHPQYALDTDLVSYYTKTQVDTNNYTKTQSDANYYGTVAADARFVNVTGDTMTSTLIVPQVTLTGGEVLHISVAGGYIAFFNGGTREGYFQGNAGGLTISSETGVLTLVGSGGHNFSGGRVDFGGQGIQGISTIAASGGISCNFVINGYTGSTGVIGNRIVLADSNGYIWSNYFNMTADVDSTGMTYAAGRESGSSFLRWYSRINVGGQIIAGKDMAAGGYSAATFFANPGAGNASISLHCGGVAPMLYSSNGNGNNVFVRDSIGNSGSVNLNALSYIIDSSMRYKKNINDWPRRSVGAAAESATDVIVKLRSVTFQTTAPDIEVPSDRRAKSLVKLNRIRATKGQAEYQLPEHDCSQHNCTGTAENPCVRVIDSTKERHGLIAEEVYQVVPSAVRLDHDLKPGGIDLGQLTTIAIAAIQELTERIKVLEEAK